MLKFVRRWPRATTKKPNSTKISKRHSGIFTTACRIKTEGITSLPQRPAAVRAVLKRMLARECTRFLSGETADATALGTQKSLPRNHVVRVSKDTVAWELSASLN